MRKIEKVEDTDILTVYKVYSSSDKDEVYFVKLYHERGLVECSCRASVFNKRCKHIKSLETLLGGLPFMDGEN